MLTCRHAAGRTHGVQETAPGHPCLEPTWRSWHLSTSSDRAWCLGEGLSLPGWKLSDFECGLLLPLYPLPPSHCHQESRYSNVMVRGQVRCHDHQLVINKNFSHWVDVIFFSSLYSNLDLRNDSRNLLLSSIKMEKCVFLFLLGQQGDLGRAGFLGKRLNYSMVLNVCFKECWHILLMLAILFDCYLFWSFPLLFPSWKSIGYHGNSVVLGWGGAVSTNAV